MSILRTREHPRAAPVPRGGDPRAGGHVPSDAVSIPLGVLRLLLLASGLALVLATAWAGPWAAWTWLAGADPEETLGRSVVAQQGANPRVGEGVTVRFDVDQRLATALTGTPLEDLHLYAMTEDGWMPIPNQVDEVDGAGTFVPREDGRVDGDDVLAFLYRHAGRDAAGESAPPEMADATARIEIAVVDPLADEGAATRHVVLFRHPGPAQRMGEPQIAWDAERRELQTDHYVLGLAHTDDDGFFGLDRLSLPGEPEVDYLDRMKLRATVEVMGFNIGLTEENLAGALVPFGGPELPLNVDPIKVGPVRVVLTAGGGAAWPRRVGLDAGLGDVPLGGGDGPVQIPVSDVRLTLDLSPAAADIGATYLDANMDEPVLVDGSPDDVPGSPVPSWRELTFGEERIVLLAGATIDGPGDPSAGVFYADDEDGIAGDTGDGASYGEHGVTGDSPAALVEAGFPGMMVAPGGGTGPAADLLATAAAVPLEVQVGHIEAVATATPTVTPTPMPTPTPTRVIIHLPRCVAGD